MSNSSPSLDPANNNTMVGMLTHVFNKLKQNFNCCLPAEIINANRNPARVQVQPLIPVVSTDGTVVQRGQIANVPVVQPGGGGWFISFPLKPGDKGWILANDRDISTYVQSFKATPPGTNRTHDFADSIFVPDIATGYNISSEDSDNMVIQNTSGSVIISLRDDQVRITATTLAVVGNITATGTIQEGVLPP